MKLSPPSPLQEAFHLNAPTAGQRRAVGIMWLIGAVIAMIWATVGNDVPEHGAIAITVAEVAVDGPVVAEAEPADPSH